MRSCEACGYLHFNPDFCPRCGDRVKAPAERVREQEPVFSDNWSATLWNVRELRKEVAALRAEQRRALIGDELDRLALSAHWAEHD